MTKCIQDNQVVIESKTETWNYRLVWKAFTSMISKYINEININYGCLGLFFNGP